jgi:hypothetical protein
MNKTRKRVVTLTLAALLFGCGDSTGPSYGEPVLLLVNGVTKATGLVGMTVLLEGRELAEARYGDVYFLATDGGAVQAATTEWANEYILATVPGGTATESKVWVETRWGVTDSVEITLINGQTFSPSNIEWTRTTDLPQALQGLGAVFVSVEWGSTQGKYIFTVGGAADGTNVATSAVFRGSVEESGGISAWDETVTQLPSERSYHAVAVATPYTAPVDTTAAGHIYAIGGIDATGAAMSSVEHSTVGLDGSVGAWQSENDLPAPVHSARARVYRGYVYVVGGANGSNAPVADAYRAPVGADGSLGAWEPIPSLPNATAYHGFVNFGPFLYVVGGDTGVVPPENSGTSGTETAATYMARIDMRDGTVPAWTSTSTPGKARGKHGMMSAGGSVVVTSGMYSGQVGSSENSYAILGSDGTLSSWGGATGSSIIQVVLGYGIFNPAAISFVDADDNGHVVVLGGGIRGSAGAASAGVVYY